MTFWGVNGGMAHAWHFRLREEVFTGQHRVVGGSMWVQWLVATILFNVLRVPTELYSV